MADTKPAKRGAKTAATAEKKRKSAFRRSMGAIVQLFLGLFSLVCIVANYLPNGKNLGGVVGDLVRDGLLGMLGGCGVLLSLGLIYAGCLTAFGRKDKTYAGKKTALLLLIVTLAGLLHLFAPPVQEAPGLAMVKVLYDQGVLTLRSGGVIGGMLTRFLLSMFNRFGTLMIYLATAILCLVVLGNVTVEGILRGIFPGREQNKAAKDQKKQEKERKKLERQWEKEDREERAGTVAPKDRRHKPGDLPLEQQQPAPPVSELPAPPTFMPRRKPEEQTQTAVLPPIAPPETPQHNPPPAPMGEAALAQEAAQVEHAVQADPGVDVYRVPPLSLLTREPALAAGAGREEMVAASAKIIETLRNFGVEATLSGASRGPTVTRYELQPAAGVKISKITNLSDDIALSLAALGVRIEAPIPGKAAIGIEVPNKTVTTVYLRSILESDQFRAAQSPLTFCLGRDVAGQPVVGDISKMPHLLIAGATGSGKSVCVNSLIISLLYKAKPSELRLIMIDPKVVELGSYNGIPHLLIPVVTNPKKAAGALAWAVGEMQKRYGMFAERGVKDISGYNMLAVGDDEVTPLPRIVIIIDELADLMTTAPAEVDEAITRLAQMARAAGMHLVIATQRPTVNVITGNIKANVPSRIAFAVSSQIDSRTILDAAGAEKLIGKGDMLYYPLGEVKPLRLQGCLVTDREVEAIVSDIKAQAQQHEYDSHIMEQIDRESEKGGKGSYADEDDDQDDMLDTAIDCVMEGGVASVSLLQRRLKLGYARAARLVDQMEARGIVGPPEGSKPRQIRITKQEWQEMRLRKMD